MPNHKYPLTATYALRPAAARKQVLRAYREAHGSTAEASRALGIPVRTLTRYVKAWGLGPEIARRWPAYLRSTRQA